MRGNLEAVSQLQRLNTLLALATGGDPIVAYDIARAIAFDTDGGLSARRAWDSVGDSARALLSFYREDTEAVGFAVCDLGKTAPGILFWQAELLARLEALCGYEEQIILIRGLKDAFVPPGHYWSNTRRQHYREVIDYLEAIAHKASYMQARLTLIFL